MKTITLFKSIYPPSIDHPIYISLVDAINLNRSLQYLDLINKIRSEKDEDERDRLKKKLPIICYSGKLYRHEDAAFKEHSGIIALDLDKFKNLEELMLFREMLLNSDKKRFILALFISPSGLGLKILIKIPPCDEKDHRSYYRGLKSFFDDDHWDDKCINISRGHFLSYDHEMYINYESSIWTEKLEEISYSPPPMPENILKTESDIVKYLEKWFEKKYKMIDGEKNNSLFVFASSLNDFGVSRGFTEYYLLQKYGTLVSEKEIKSVIKSAYNKPGGTKFFEDRRDKNIIINTGNETLGNKGYVKYNDVSSLEKFRALVNEKYPRWIFFTVYDKNTRVKLEVIKHY